MITKAGGPSAVTAMPAPDSGIGQAKEWGTAKGPKRPKGPKPLSARQVRRLNLRLWRIEWELIRAGQVDHAVGVIGKALHDQVSSRLSELAKWRGLVEAERADRGVVCWELFCQRDGPSIFGMQKKYKRTPRRIWSDIYYSLPPAWEVAVEEDPWKDLDRLWHEHAFDVVKFRAHAAQVDRQWRAHLAKDVEAA